jgi:two-component system response regulator NreC
MLSMHSDETYVLRCLRAGARAYVLKESAEHELIAALRAAVSGKSFFSPKVRRLLQQEHAARLHLSLYTVETHRGNILEKLGLHGTADLILYAVRKGLIR